MLILLCFFLSGASALIYQVVWLRMLTLVFGSTTYAVSTILGIFMAGLAIGAFFGGKFIDRRINPTTTILIYAILELIIGIYAFWTPYILKILPPIYISNFYISSLFRFIFCFFILIIPTILMGATLPILCKFWTDNIEKIGLKVGTLYSINTFGAALGCFLAGFIFIPKIGVSSTLHQAVAYNLIAAGISFLVYLRVNVGVGFIRPKNNGLDKSSPYIKATKSPILYLILFAIFLSGFCALTYEVVWTRTLILIIGSSIYAFTLMLTTFLFGIVLGSFIISRIVDRQKDLIFMFAIIQGLIGAFALLSIILFNPLPLLFLKLFKVFGLSFFNLQFMNFIISALIMLIPTTLMGSCFPLAVKLYTKSLDNIGEGVGKVYSLNTSGAVLGSLLSGFLLIPLIGLKNTMHFALIINLLLAIIILYHAKINKHNLKIATTFFISLIIIFSFFTKWKKETISRGVFMEVNRIMKTPDTITLEEYLKTQEKFGEVIFYKEGINSTVSVVKEGKNFFLKINGKTDASTDKGDMPTQLLLGHLPMLLAKNPKDVLVIGSGSGITLGAVEQYNIKNVELIEIEKAVLSAANYFKKENRHCLSDKKLKIIVEDGRNYLLKTNKLYDVITSEPSNPWIIGCSNLFTKEYYEIVKKRLKKDGVFCQWTQLYGMSKEDLKIIINTFYSVFPNISIWTTALGDVLLIGSLDRLVIDYSRIEKLINGNKNIKGDFLYLGLPNFYIYLATGFLFDERKIEEYAYGSNLNTDDKPIIEFSSPKNLYLKNTSLINYKELRKFRVKPEVVNFVPPYKTQFEMHYYLGIAYYHKQLEEEAISHFIQAIKFNKNNATVYHYLGNSFAILGIYKEALSAFQREVELAPNSAQAHFNLGICYNILGYNDEAIRAITVAKRIDPKINESDGFFKMPDQ